MPQSFSSVNTNNNNRGFRNPSVQENRQNQFQRRTPGRIQPNRQVNDISPNFIRSPSNSNFELELQPLDFVQVQHQQPIQQPFNSIEQFESFGQQQQSHFANSQGTVSFGPNDSLEIFGGNAFIQK